jgi:hypothetical protein
MSFSIYNDDVTLRNRESSLSLTTTTANITDYITTRRIITPNTGQITIGTSLSNTQENSISIGLSNGSGGGGTNSICIGRNANWANAANTISISFGAGQNSNSGDNICIGYQAGGRYAKNNSILIGGASGYSGCGIGTVAIGSNSSYISPSNDGSVSLGFYCGYFNQGSNTVAVGYQAGYNSQGNNAISIGNQAGYNSQHANSIILNASGTSFNSSTINSFFVKPIRTAAGGATNLLAYDTTANVNEIYLSSSKTFVIDHPLDNDKYLVHGCLEGPEAGVYYRGQSEIMNDESVEIKLSGYVKSFSDFTVQITPIYNGNINIYNSSEVIDGKFRVYGNNGKFYWFVHCLREEIDIELLKSETEVKGEGPYRYIK